MAVRFGRSFGVMQGRLSEQTPFGYQSFPWEHWQLEFELASSRSLQHIEWVIDSRRLDENPLLSSPSLVSAIIDRTGVEVTSVCADYLMDTPLALHESASWDRLERLLTSMNKVGATHLIIPFVDQSSFSSTRAGLDFLRSSDRLGGLAKDAGIQVALETDLAPDEFSRLLVDLDPQCYGVNYDIGNSASLGFDARLELSAYCERISILHVKDRIEGGKSVPLGNGDADIFEVFRTLQEVGFAGITTMQAFRDLEGLTVLDRQLTFIQALISELQRSADPS